MKDVFLFWIVWMGIFFSSARVAGCDGQESRGGGGEAIISWEIDTSVREGKLSGKAAVGVVTFFWNDDKLGVEEVGLAKLYTRIQNFEGPRVVYRSMPKGEWISLRDPLFEPGVYEHFSSLLRSKRIALLIDFGSREDFNVLPSPGNPFEVEGD